MDRSIILQILNGLLAVTALGGFFIFGRYMVRERHLGYANLRPAIAILGLFGGEIVLRLPIFLTRIQINTGHSVEAPTFAIILGGAIVEVSFLCMIRVFAPEKWGYWSWLGTILLSLLVVLVSLGIVEWA